MPTTCPVVLAEAPSSPKPIPSSRLDSFLLPDLARREKLCRDPPVQVLRSRHRALRAKCFLQLPRCHRMSMWPRLLHPIAPAAQARRGWLSVPSRLRRPLPLSILGSAPPRCPYLSLCRFRLGRRHPRCPRLLLVPPSLSFPQHLPGPMARTPASARVRPKRAASSRCHLDPATISVTIQTTLARKMAPTRRGRALAPMTEITMAQSTMTRMSQMQQT